MHSRQKQPRQRHFTKQITTPVEIIDIDRGMKVSKGELKNHSIQKKSKEQARIFKF